MKELEDSRERAARIDGADPVQDAMVISQFALVARSMQRADAGPGLPDDAGCRWAERVPAAHPIFADVHLRRAELAVMRHDPAAAQSELALASSHEEAPAIDRAVTRGKLADLRRRRRTQAARARAQGLPCPHDSCLPGEVGREAIARVALPLRARH